MTDQNEFDLKLTAGGGVLRPHQSILSAAAEEYSLVFGESDIQSTVVDPANVLMVEATLDPWATGEYTPPEGAPREVGVNDTIYKKAVSNANKGRGDSYGTPVTLKLDTKRGRFHSSFSKTHGSVDVDYSTRWTTIDPDSIRQVGGPPSLDLPGRADVPAKAFVAAAEEAISATGDALKISIRGSTLTFSCETETSSKTPSIEGVASVADGGVETIISSYYTEMVLKAIKSAKPETVTVEVGEESPVVMQASMPDIGLDFSYTLAPRIGGD